MASWEVVETDRALMLIASHREPVPTWWSEYDGPYLGDREASPGDDSRRDVARVSRRPPGGPGLLLLDASLGACTPGGQGDWRHPGPGQGHGFPGEHRADLRRVSRPRVAARRCDAGDKDRREWQARRLRRPRSRPTRARDLRGTAGSSGRRERRIARAIVGCLGCTSARRAEQRADGADVIVSAR